MNWLRIDAALLNHPKVGRLSRALGIDSSRSIGIIVTLWSWVIVTRPDGSLEGLSGDDIGYACRWDDGPAIVAALIASGWIDETEDGMEVHEWMEYQGAYEKAKLMAARRQDRHRKRHEIGFKESRNGGVTHRRDKGVTTGRTDRTDGQDGEDADRDTVSRSPTAATAASVAALHSDQAPAAPADPSLATFPCTKGRVWHCTETTARKLDEFYPELVMEDEIRDALAWVSADPAERCRAPDRMVQFLTGWLKRSDERRRNGGAHAT